MDAMHSYFWIEAARSFREALDRDPGVAMAELGLSRAYRNIGLRKPARAHLDRAQELKAGASERERLTIDARAIQWEAIFGPSDQRVRLHNEYRAALDDLVAKYPDDAEGWVTRGNASEAQPWRRGQLGGRQSTEWYLGALERDPNHGGAHHYLLHAYERLAQYEQATEHAAVYASGARLAPHA